MQLSTVPTDRWVQMIAMSIAKDTAPTDPIQVTIADAVLGNGWNRDGGHYARGILVRLTQGLTKDNVAERIGMVAAKTRRLAADEHMRFVVLDIAALDADGDDLPHAALILAQHLARMIPIARSLGLSTVELLRIMHDIPGEIGERIICQALAGADDVDRDVKIGHIERRMASATATGDDRDLIGDILTVPLSPDELSRWQTAFGEPSPPPGPDSGPNVIGDNWARAWRWSLVLPLEVLENWTEAIAAVTAQHGAPTPSSLDTRVPRFTFGEGRSPHRADELSALPVLDAAALVASWRPSKDDDWGVGPLDLARELEAVVRENPRGWTEDPATVVATLREPVYVDHYFRAITQRASDVPDRANAVMAGVELIRAEQWEPTQIGRDRYGYEPGWSLVDPVIVEMIAAFANKNGELAADLDMCWVRASELFRRLPDEMPAIEPSEGASELDDPLSRAINRPYGKALEAVLALGGWEHRNRGAASSQLVEILDEVLALPGSVGLELRSMLASHRPFLETVTPAWLDAVAGDLFGGGPLGTITFDQTLKWSRPTKWFFARYKAELIAAARQGKDRAVSWLLIAFLWDEPGYAFADLAGGLGGHVPALTEAAEEMASLMQETKLGDPIVDRGLQFWAELLDADRRLVPAETLIGSGRWTFVNSADEPRWFELMDRTLGLTNGEIDMAIEIADRCKAAQPSSRGLRMLRVMVGHGEPWERNHIETASVEALRIAATHSVDDEFYLLRTRLIERGQHEAADINPEVEEG